MPHKSRSDRPLKNAKVVESFRGEAKASVPLHELELALVVIACFHLCFLPWALGARDAWAQITSAVLGTLALVVACCPRHYRGELAPQGAFVLHPWSRLLKFPVFWLGLVLFGYVTCQGLNPAYRRVEAFPYWWLIPIDHITWLPSGVDAPFEKMNAWRTLCIWGGAWALACALWVGLTRRVSSHAILTVLVANGGLLALVGILQKVTDAKEVLWFIKPSAYYFASTFFYKNHAGAYFNLILTIAVALMAWHYIRAYRRLERSSPAPVYAFAVVIIAAMVFLSNSRAAMGLFIGYAIATCIILSIWRIRNRGDAAVHPALSGLMAIGSLTLVIGTASILNIDKSIEQLRYVTSEDGQKIHLEPRILAREATLDLFELEKTFGWGAGSFRHTFPITQKNYDAIFRYAPGNTMFLWDNAHNDYAQILAEIGLVGTSLIGLMVAWFFIKCIRLGIWRQPPYLVFLLGLGLPMAHAWLDFPFHNCAILTTACASAMLLVRWAELEINRT